MGNPRRPVCRNGSSKCDGRSSTTIFPPVLRQPAGCRRSQADPPASATGPASKTGDKAIGTEVREIVTDDSPVEPLPLAVDQLPSIMQGAAPMVETAPPTGSAPLPARASMQLPTAPGPVNAQVTDSPVAAEPLATTPIMELESDRTDGRRRPS